MHKHFSFIYPVTKRLERVQRFGGQLFEHVADLLVRGVVYVTKASLLNNIAPKYQLDITEIIVEGQNIYPCLHEFESLENIEAACINHLEQMEFDANGTTEYDEPPKMYPALAKVITMPLKRKVK